MTPFGYLSMKPIPLLRERTPLWQIGCAHGVNRKALHAVLGRPHHTETDELRTFGGEEDTWRFELPGGIFFFIELRVPYGEAAIISNRETITPSLREACSRVPGALELYPQAYPLR
jgi:hypothetical protein